MSKKNRFITGIVATLTIVATAHAKDISAYGHAPDLAAMERAAVSTIKANLKDPDSAEFDWASAEVKLGKRGWFICGSFNAKNSYGGYTGYSNFLVRKAASPADMSVTIKMAPGNLRWDECSAYNLATRDQMN